MTISRQPGTHSASVLLRGHLEGLRPAQRRVAEVLLAQPDKAVGWSIRELAERAETSQATVVRLCQELGLDGYPELRLMLATERGRRDRDGSHHQGDIAEGDDLAQVVHKIAAADAAAVQDTIAEIDLPTLERVIDELARAESIHLYGVGASGLVATDMAQKLLRIGRRAQAFTDAHIGLVAAALMGPGTVAFAVSHSGTTPDTLDMMSLAAERGATTVALTNSLVSPLARRADHVLVTAARESTFRSGATASRLAQLTLVDCVFVGLAQRTYEGSQQALTRTFDALHGRGAQGLV